MKTVIKGFKEVKRLVGIKYEDDMPILNYQTFLVGDDKPIQEVDYELITDDQHHIIITLSGLSIHPKQLNILYDGQIELVSIVKEEVKDDVKTIFVDKVVETEEQKFNHRFILGKYCDEFNEFYNKFMEQFENDKPIQIKIKQWLDGGMSKEEVVRELRKGDIQKVNLDDVTISTLFHTGGIPLKYKF